MTVEQAVDKYGNLLFKICLVQLCNESDAQDAVQETFYRYWRENKRFNEEEHEKAWLIRVAINRCRDIRRFEKRHPAIELEELADYYETEEQGTILQEILVLPDKLKLVLQLFYIQGYHVEEIAKMLSISENAVKKRLQRGRSQLRENLKGVDFL